MNKNFYLIFLSLSGIFFLGACIKKDSPKQIEENLKISMELSLNHNPRIDTSRVKFKVLEVTYFEAPKGFICEFKVNMKEKRDGELKDTTGMMSANISKDFKNVTRRD
jgi:hypothetical protein